MLDGIIKNSDNSYELLKVINGKLGAFHVSKDGFSKSDNKYINTILNKLHFNSNCIYLTDIDGYSIYYDRETSFKHFIREDKEDYEMFFRTNGRNITMYLASDLEKRKSKKRKKVVRAFEITALSITIILGSLDVFHFSEKYGVSEELIVLGIHSVTDLYDMYKMGPMNYMEAIDEINESDFDGIDKQLLGNEELLKLVFKYYKNTPMEYTANFKFNDIKLKVYTGDEGEREAENYGYYSILEPNVLHVRNDSKSSTLVHEFIHLLQADGCYYSYLNEAVATLMTKEFYNLDSQSYPDAVDNLKLLISIVGPEPIYKLVFGGDDSSLFEIFRDNLTDDEMISLVTELRNSPSNSKDSEQYQFIRESLFKLYKNMYGSDISDNAELSLIFLTEEGNDSYSPLYLNIYKIMDDSDERSILIHEEAGKSVLVRLGYLNVLRNDYNSNTSYDEYVSVNPNVLVLKTGEVLYTTSSMKNKFYDQYFRISEGVIDTSKVITKNNKV